MIPQTERPGSGSVDRQHERACRSPERNRQGGIGASGEQHPRAPRRPPAGGAAREQRKSTAEHVRDRDHQRPRVPRREVCRRTRRSWPRRRCRRTGRSAAACTRRAPARPGVLRLDEHQLGALLPSARKSASRPVQSNSQGEIRTSTATAPAAARTTNNAAIAKMSTSTTCFSDRVYAAWSATNDASRAKEAEPKRDDERTGDDGEHPREQQRSRGRARRARRPAAASWDGAVTLDVAYVVDEVRGARCRAVGAEARDRLHPADSVAELRGEDDAREDEQVLRPLVRARATNAAATVDRRAGSSTTPAAESNLTRCDRVASGPLLDLNLAVVERVGSGPADAYVVLRGSLGCRCRHRRRGSRRRSPRRGCRCRASPGRASCPPAPPPTRISTRFSVATPEA